MKFLAGVLGILMLGAGMSRAQDYVPGQLYAIFKPNRITLSTDSTGFTCCGIARIDSINRVNKCVFFRNASRVGAPLLANDFRVGFPDSADIIALATAYRADTNVVWAGPNYPAQLCFTPNDPHFKPPLPPYRLSSYQWPLDLSHLQMEKAWDITKGNSGVVIAILELGLAWRHPDLEPNVWINSGEDINHNNVFDIPGDLNGIDDDSDGYVDDVIGYNFACDPPDPNPEPTVNCPQLDQPLTGDIYFVHGSRVWSNAAAATNNDTGVAGVAFNCRVMPMAFNYNDLATLGDALVFLINMRNKYHVPDVVNMSFAYGAIDSVSLANPTTVDLLDSLNQLGVVLIAAAGNGSPGKDQTQFPASHPGVISVAGTDSVDYKADLSNYNSNVALSAPAFNYMATHNFDHVNNVPINYRYASLESLFAPYGEPIRGTSYSAPQVAGAAALMRSAYPSFTVDEIRAKLRSSVDPIQFPDSNNPPPWAGKMGAGRLNCFKALTFFGNIPGESANDTTLAGTVYVSGDITVRNGKTLRLAAGTVLRFYPGDVMRAGVDTEKAEIIVQAGGKLIIEGTSGNPVKLLSFRKEPDSTTTNDWRGIVVRPGGYISVNNAIIRHAYAGIEDSSAYSHTLQNVKIGRCTAYGILASSTDSLTIRGCSIDSVNGSPGGYGIYLASETSKGAKLVADTARACYYGFFISVSTAAVESCRVEGAAGGLTSYVGIYSTEQALYDTSAIVPIAATSVSGYFSQQLFHNAHRGQTSLSDNCNLTSATSPSRSPYCIRNTDSQARLKVRGSVLREWGSAGVLTAHNNSQFADLGTVSNPADSGFNIIYTTASGSSWKYVKDNDCAGCSTPTIKAEWNCYNVDFPQSSRFSTNVDWNPYDNSCFMGKVVAGNAGDGGTATLPKPTALFQNYPNPFNPTTQIQFNLEKAEKVSLEIFNILGQRVRTMLSGEEFAAGPYSFIWDGRDDRGGALSSGMYFYRLKTPTFLQTKKMTFIK